MKKLFYSLAIIAAVTACNEEMKESDSPVNGEGKTFTAKFEGSKVYMGEDYYYRWQAGDLVSVFTDASHDQYKAVTGDVTETDLEYVSTTAALESTLDKSYAVYPYNAANALEDGVVYTEIAAEQTYSPNGLGNAIMVSETSGSEFVFKNACALVKVNLTIAEDFTNLHAVKSIRVSSKSKPLSGAATINVAGGDYAAKMATQTLAAENAVTLVGCEEAGLLQADEALTFYLAIPAGSYEAGDLAVSVLTDTQSAPFNQVFTLSKSYNINRSQYIEVTATLAKDYTWFEGNEEEVIIKEDVTLIDKAIMTYDANLILQGFDGQDRIQTIFDVPDHDMTITGWDLVNGGYAQTAENGPVITFKKADADHIMNTLTTTNSGIKGVTPNKITLKALTITGELRTTTMGIYVKNEIVQAIEGKNADQSAFNTEWINVNVIDCVVPLYTNEYGCAVCIYGTSVLKNCKISGTTPASVVPADQYGDIYDACITNNATTTMNNTEVGTIQTWEHTSLTIQNGSKIGRIDAKTNAVVKTSKIEVNNSEVNEIDYTVLGSVSALGTRLTLTSGAKVGTVKLPKLETTKYTYTITIEEGSTIDKVVYDGVEMTLEEFKASYPDFIK